MKLLPPPGRERRQQLIRLGIVLFGLLIVAWYQWPQAAPVAPTSNVPADRPQPSTQASVLPEPVRLGALEQVTPATEIGRNPFTFGTRSAVPQAVVRSAPTVNPVTEVTGLPQGPPPISLRLAGLMVGPGTDRKLATLKDPATGAIFHAFEGDIVDGRYRLVKVGEQSVVVSYVDGAGIRTLGLGN